MITIFTPTYNRVGFLPRIYVSLLEQSIKDIEWLIIDDGSSDNTKDLVESFISEGKINITYVFQENSGKMVAYNKAIELAKGELFFCLDSDDFLLDNSLKYIVELADQYDGNEIVGYAFNNWDRKNEKISGTEFPENYMKLNHQDMYYKYQVKGDKNFVFYLDKLKEYHHPVAAGEKFVPEAVMFNRIGEKYVFVCSNQCITSIEYQDDGYSMNYKKLAMSSPKGHSLYFLELYKYQPTLYNIYAYIMYSYLSGYSISKIVRVHPRRLVVLIMLLPVRLITTYRRYQQRRQ